MAESLHDQNPLVLIIMKGGFVFANELLKNCNFPLEVDYIHATRYQDSVSGNELEWKVAVPKAVAGRTVLVIDDIYDEGVTLKAVIEEVEASGAQSVKTAVFVVKEHERNYGGIAPDFIAASVPDEYVFGFGMDYQGYWRNAPGIYAVKGL